MLLSTSILYNCVLAYSRPFVQWYNMALHYFNEFSFFFYICMCMTFTDFVDDIPTRQSTGSVLSTMMFAILSFNVLICLIALILTQKHLCEKVDLLPEISDKILNRKVFNDELSDRKILMNPDESARMENMSHDFILQRGDRTVVEPDEVPQLLQPQVYQHQPSGYQRKKTRPDLDALLDEVIAPMKEDEFVQPSLLRPVPMEQLYPPID